MKGDCPYFYPTIPYNVTRGMDDEKLDLRQKKPIATVQNPMQAVEDGAEQLYNTDLDKWFLNNQMHFESYKLHRGIARIYAGYL